jgi:hypothetical protein
MPAPHRKPCGILDIGTIQKKFRERRGFVDGHASRSKAWKCVHDHATVGILAQAAANADDVCLGKPSLVMRAMLFPAPACSAAQADKYRATACSAAVTPWQPAGTAQSY